MVLHCRVLQTGAGVIGQILRSLHGRLPSPAHDKGVTKVTIHVTRLYPSGGKLN